MQTKSLGDYIVIKPIGQGALGSVFLAEHRFMKKQYALKVLPLELSGNRHFIQRFQEEVGMLTSLEHPNLVKIHNVSFAEGQYFLVTDCIVDEYGETTNLNQYLLEKGGALKQEEIYELLSQLAAALDYGHQFKLGNLSLAHRGIKMNNILVSKKGKDVTYMLSDYGLSRIIGTGAALSKTFQSIAESMQKPPAGGAESSDPAASSSWHNVFLQNFAFLAPEQKRGESSVDGKTDVYAFGVLAYYLLMREFPEGYFPLPSERMPCRTWNWDHLIRSCMACDPNKRPKVLKEVMDHLSVEQVNATAESFAIPIRQGASAAVGSQSGSTLRPVLHTQQLERPEHDPDPAKLFEIDTSVKHYEPENAERANVAPLLTDMVVVPGGSFWRGSQDGSRDEIPKHMVNLSSFAIDIHPVTNEQFVRFLEAMGGEKDSHHRDIIRLRDSRIKRSGGRLSVESGYLKHPVVGVTWYGALAYARWVGKRLPTEAEWEIAAAGGDLYTLYPTGEDVEKSQANFFSSDTTPVMSYPPGHFGIYDMAGNVYEWCHDWYGYNSYETAVQEPDDPRGPLQGVYRVLRGGCWKSLKEDLRCSRRHRNNPGTVNSTYGFRCAADVSTS